MAPIRDKARAISRIRRENVKLRIGMGQMSVVGGDRDGNLARAEAMIGKAAAAQCDMVVLPECLDLGWTHPSAATHGKPIPGSVSTRIANSARRHKLYVAAGLTEFTGSMVYNAAILINPHGQFLLRHRKINELDIARKYYGLGDQLSVAETPWGRVGLLICADNFPDSDLLGKCLARMGARLVLSPCAWVVPADHDPVATPYGDLWEGAYRSLARETGLITVGVSNVGPIEAGPWKGRLCIGCSMAMGADGSVLAQAPYGVDAVGLFVVDVAL